MRLKRGSEKERGHPSCWMASLTESGPARYFLWPPRVIAPESFLAFFKVFFAISNPPVVIRSPLRAALHSAIRKPNFGSEIRSAARKAKHLGGRASAVIGEKLPRGEKSPHLRVVCPSLTGASSVSGSHGMCRRGAVRGVSGGCRDGPAGSRRWASHWRGGRVRGDSILRKKRAIRNQDGPRH